MPRRPSPALTDAESQIMGVLWTRGAATVGDVVAVLQRGRQVSYSTVQTILRILESKGYVAHTKVARAFKYHPLIDEQGARRQALRHLAGRLFNNSPSLLVLNVLDDDQLDPAELKRLKKLIADA